MDKKRIYLSCPTMHGEEQEFIREAFDTNWVAPLGPNVNAFEKEMEAYTGAGHASALSAGTAAIHLALRERYRLCAESHIQRHLQSGGL